MIVCIKCDYKGTKIVKALPVYSDIVKITTHDKVNTRQTAVKTKMK